MNQNISSIVLRLGGWVVTATERLAGRADPTVTTHWELKRTVEGNARYGLRKIVVEEAHGVWSVRELGRSRIVCDRARDVNQLLAQAGCRLTVAEISDALAERMGADEDPMGSVSP